MLCCTAGSSHGRTPPEKKSFFCQPRSGMPDASRIGALINMATKARDRLKTAYRQERALEVFYTGGPAKVSADGRLACACDGEVKVR